ncbi:MAG: rhodanese-like domain-containing protein [Zetaproteobacteria bacterium]|nr:rhodanese-like domain-containing protein [Zetaproteobacteria bacterium]
MDVVISFYKFVTIKNPSLLRESLQATTARLQIMGSIIVAEEGINGMLSGSEANIRSFEQEMHTDARFADLEFKESLYDDVSFRRMLVKQKKEIITLRQPIDPQKDTGAYLDPLEFKKWQDEAKDMVILDTRNDYEVALGTFKNAVDPKIRSFGEFPEWVDQNLSADKEKTIVTFCTGGIRCEKATAYMKMKGFTNVYQIEGGILKYFEKTLQEEGDNHWQGDCVVFDKRKAIDKKLEPSRKEICYVCLAELTPANKASEPRAAGHACTTCDAQMEQSHRERVARGMQRHADNLKRRHTFLLAQKEHFKGLRHDHMS